MIQKIVYMKLAKQFISNVDMFCQVIFIYIKPLRISDDVIDVKVNNIYMHGEHDCMTFTPHTYLPNSILLSFDVLSGHLYLSHLSTQS